MLNYLLLLVGCSLAAAKYNVLMITVDDLRPQLAEAYGMPQVQTPYMDELAKTGTTFKNAYCQIAVCSPSRNSFMTGRRPDKTKVWNFINHFREPAVGANWTSLPGYFKNNGYLVYSSGKMFHPAHPPNNDFEKSYTHDAHQPTYWGNGLPIGDAGGCSDGVLLPLKEKWGNSEVCLDVNDAAALNNNDDKNAPQDSQPVEYDHRLATRTIESLQAAKNQSKNFYVSVGFRKPHIVWRVPQRFYDMYKGKSLDLAKHQTLGKNTTTLAFEMNAFAGNTFPNGTLYTYGPNTPLPEEYQEELRRGYYAAVSFLDFEVGRVLAELEQLGLADSTAVLLHSDHGWKLGEHGDWSKCTNWELDARVPLLVRAPWIKESIGRKTEAMAELIDAFPTLVELAGLPPVPASEGIDGTSLVPALKDPTHTSPHNKTAAFSQFPRCPSYDMRKQPSYYECLDVDREKIGRMGYSIRVKNARYTEWRLWKPSCQGDWTPAGLVSAELYDHTGDTGLGFESYDEFEFENLAYLPERATQVASLAAQLKEQYDKPATC